MLPNWFNPKSKSTRVTAIGAECSPAEASKSEPPLPLTNAATRKLVSGGNASVPDPTLQSTCESVQRSMLSSSFHHQSASAVADQHARRLLRWLQHDLKNAVGEARVFLAREVEASYADMCDELKLHSRPWNAVAAKFAILIRQPHRPLKTYTDRINKAGRKQRLRCYVIPLPS